MISYIEGKILSKTDKYIVVKAGPIGYKIFMSSCGITKVPGEGQNIELFCFMNVGENKMDLYGFLSQEELDFFEILEGIRGIGPKTALEISGIGSLEKIKEKIKRNDDSVFEGVVGIGSKKKATIILELSGKIKSMTKKEDPIEKEAEDGLVNLGFKKTDVKSALKKIDAKTAEEKIKEALKILKNEKNN